MDVKQNWGGAIVGQQESPVGRFLGIDGGENETWSVKRETRQERLIVWLECLACLIETYHIVKTELHFSL